MLFFSHSLSYFDRFRDKRVKLNHLWVSVLNGDGNDTMAIENSINGNRLTITIDVFGNR